MPAVKPQSQTRRRAPKADNAVSGDSKQSTKAARKSAPVKVAVKTAPKRAPKADSSQKTATVNLVVVKKETPGAFQMEPSAAYLKGTGAKAPFVRQAYVRKSLGVEFETQKTVDLTFGEGSVRGSAIMFKEQERKGKALAMQALYIVGADRLGLDESSTVKVRLSLLPKDQGVKLIINPA